MGMKKLLFAVKTGLILIQAVQAFVITCLLATLISILWERVKTYNAWIEETYKKYQRKRDTWIKKEVNHEMGTWAVERHVEPGTMTSFVKACFTAGFCAGPQKKSFFSWKWLQGRVIQLIGDLNGPPEHSQSHVHSLTGNVCRYVISLWFQT